MITLKIATFDLFDPRDYDISYNVIKEELIVSNDIRLRCRRGIVYTFLMDKGKHYYHDYCFGIMQTIEIDESNYDWLNYIMECRGYEPHNVKVSSINTTLDDITNNDFIVIDKHLVMTYTAIMDDKMRTLYDKRCHRVNMVPKFFIKIKELEEV